MNIGDELSKMLSKKYEPSTLLETKFKGKDLSFKTDKEGNPVTLFIGRRDTDGAIKGERYTRMLIQNPDGKVIKDHWDLKGTTR